LLDKSERDLTPSLFLCKIKENSLPMNVEKVKLIIKNMELLVKALQLEIEEAEKEKNIVIKLDDIIGNHSENLDDYEPDYYEEP
jgi:hypothetical protein